MTSLSRFPSVMPLAVEAVIGVTAALKHVRDTTGDLRFRDIQNVQRGLHSAKKYSIGALQEGAKAPAAAQAFMAGLGGPATLADFQAKVMDIEAKAASWNALLVAFIDGLPASAFAVVAPLTVDGVESHQFQQTEFAKEAEAETLRKSAALQALIEAFEAVGG